MSSKKTGLLLGEEIAGVNQILPHKHKYAWDLFLKGVANKWSPAEINMTAVFFRKLCFKVFSETLEKI